jgi:enolase
MVTRTCGRKGVQNAVDAVNGEMDALSGMDGEISAASTRGDDVLDGTEQRGAAGANATGVFCRVAAPAPSRSDRHRSAMSGHFGAVLPTPMMNINIGGACR